MIIHFFQPFFTEHNSLLSQQAMEVTLSCSYRPIIPVRSITKKEELCSGIYY